MARISGVTLPPNKKLYIGLTYIYGIGEKTSNDILKLAKIDGNIRVKDLDEKLVGVIRDIIEKSYKVEGELKRERLMNIKRLKEIGSYRGTRHQRGLPVRGQRTKTNTRTVRGNVRRTMGSGRKLANQKT